jgi:hypothetical protein
MNKLVFLLFLLPFSLLAQKDTVSLRRFIGFQAGGQAMVSGHYEYSLIAKKYFVLNTETGLGINENADDSDPTDRAIYVIQTGLITFIGTRLISLELGAGPSTYFYKSTTFINLNGWMGLRVIPKKMEGFFISAGYTPRLYYTYTDPNNHFFDAWIGVKAGVNF